MRSTLSSFLRSTTSRTACPIAPHGSTTKGLVNFHNVQQTRNTTILCVKKDGKVAMAGDGLVTQGNYKVKPNALKIRCIGKGITIGGIIIGTCKQLKYTVLYYLLWSLNLQSMFCYNSFTIPSQEIIVWCVGLRVSRRIVLRYSNDWNWNWKNIPVNWYEII